MARIKATKNKNQLLIINPVDKPCFYCEKPLEGGRSDRRFCNDICRNNYNNVIRQTENNLMRNINNALNKNRRVLESLVKSGTTKATKQSLLKAGFEFEYHTHTRTNKNGGIYYFCYDYGYLSLPQGFLIVKDNT